MNHDVMRKRKLRERKGVEGRVWEERCGRKGMGEDKSEEEQVLFTTGQSKFCCKVGGFQSEGQNKPNI